MIGKRVGVIKASGLKIGTFCLLIVLVITLTSCNVGHVKEIGDGYSINTIYSGADILVDPNNSVIVTENVAEYVVSGRYIVGLRDRAPTSEAYPKEFEKDFKQEFGYFIVDKEAQKTRIGVPKEEFAVFIKENGIDFDL